MNKNRYWIARAQTYLLIFIILNYYQNNQSTIINYFNLSVTLAVLRPREESSGLPDRAVRRLSEGGGREA